MNEPNDNELMDIVKKDITKRIVNTMLKLKTEHNFIYRNIWFYHDIQKEGCIILQNEDKKIMNISYFGNHLQHKSLPYKPFFIEDQDNNNDFKGIVIGKYGDDEDKIKSITADLQYTNGIHKCKITFKTNNSNKITNVEVTATKYKYSDTKYIISLNEAGEIEKITKKGNKDANNKDYKQEIKQLLFIDKMHKHLIDHIECELDSQQREVFEKIKNFIDVEEEKKEEDEEEKKDKEENNKNNNLSSTNLDNTPQSFGTYNKDGKKVYCCFGCDISCL